MEILCYFCEHIQARYKMRIVVESILFLFGLAENPLQVHIKSGSEAMKSDWENIGRDIRKAMKNYEETAHTRQSGNPAC